MRRTLLLVIPDSPVLSPGTESVDLVDSVVVTASKVGRAQAGFALSKMMLRALQERRASKG